MRTQLVKFGNSKGLRIPKALVDLLRLDGPLELSAEGGALIVRPVANPRAGWAKAAAEAGPDQEDWSAWQSAGTSAWDDEEWEWPQDHQWPKEPGDSTPISSPLIPSSDRR